MEPSNYKINFRRMNNMSHIIIIKLDLNLSQHQRENI